MICTEMKSRHIKFFHIPINIKVKSNNKHRIQDKRKLCDKNITED